MGRRKRSSQLHRVRAALGAGQWQLAASACEAAFEHKPEDPKLRCCLAEALCGLGDPEAAVAELEKAARRDAATPAAWCAVGDAFARHEQPGRAGECYRRALARAGHYQPARRGLAALGESAHAPAAARRRRWPRVVALGLAGCVLAMAAWLALDSQAIPKTVDAVRSVVGDRAVLWAEEGVFGGRDWLEDHLPRRAPRLAQPVNAAAIAKPPPPAAATTVAEDVPPALSSDGEDARAGQWIDHGTYRTTHVYPEPNHRSIADVAYLKKGAALHVACGTREPAEGDGAIAPAHLARTFLAFSGGFQYKHFPSGIMSEGCLLRPLRSGVGTLVVLHDNQVRIGVWGREWTHVLPQMKDIRQCLLLVDQGRFNENVNFNAYAIGSAVRVYRSALGVTERGNLVYAAGDRLSAQALARTLINCGVTAAVHLDMNYGNATCGVITHDKGQTHIEPLSSRFPDASRFLGSNYRDFLYVEEPAGGG